MKMIRLVGLLLSALAGLYLLMLIVWPILMQSYIEVSGESPLVLYVIYALVIVGATVIGGVAFGGKKHE